MTEPECCCEKCVPLLVEGWSEQLRMGHGAVITFKGVICPSCPIHGTTARIEEMLWDALMQGAYVCTVAQHGIKPGSLPGCTPDTVICDNACTSTWEEITAYFASRGKLRNINGRLYEVVQ